MGKSKRVWLHPDSGLEGVDGCLRLLFTAAVGLLLGGIFICLVTALLTGSWQWLSCVRGGDC